LADWIGSHEEWFPYTIPDPTVDLATALDSYWMLAKERAAHAVRCAGLYAPPLAQSKSFSSLTGIAHPSPAQEWAEDVRIPETPTLFILEDVTGSGKTEAAQMLVHRLLCAGKGSGAYWAMPTQATANAMYSRQGDAIAALFADDSSTRPSLALAHGQARLNARFQKSVLNGTVSSAVTDMKDAADSELPSGAACAAFLADDRRTSLLADIGAGTIDQAILGVLPTRFNALRLFALSEKILIIDEAHAYDAYVSRELEVLLQFHSSLGGSAIVLSATLAKSQREGLIHAWLRGSSQYNPDDVTLSMSYPLATVVARNTNVVEETPLDAAPRVRRSIAVRFVHSANSIIEEILRGQEIGATVAWVRNSVGDCLDAARELREKGLDPIVFHARFAQCDRQAREQEILHLFGPGQNGDGPKKVVIATQVIEQSLDISFEMMFSDVAPIDLLIQRAGRLQRHEARGSGRRRSNPELVVLAPVMADDPPADWLKGLLPATAYIYGNTGVIWRTVRALVQTGHICSPGTAGEAASIRALIEAVYGNDYTPEHLEPITIKAEGEEKAARATANYSTLVPRDGYNAISAGWVNDVHASTRLGLEKTVIRLAMVQPNGSLAPWACVVGSDDPEWKQWALSEVRISKHFIPPDVMADSEYDGAIAVARKKWGKYEQDIPVLPLEIGADGVAAGEFRSRSNKERVIRVLYTTDDGLSIV
jgi:CRISPR-associated endonuclease/helicase Cas3